MPRRVTNAGPVVPVDPEWPDLATGFEMAVDASPVRPELPEGPDRPKPIRRVSPFTAEFVPLRLARASAVLPVPPESPDRAVGLPPANDEALPVSPVLVAEDCAVEAPESPE